jgi:hypothetical protein
MLLLANYFCKHLAAAPSALAVLLLLSLLMWLAVLLLWQS